jgi:hypothetical protein
MTDQDYIDGSLPDADRREFLRKSIYAAYATPLITALLVEEASAKNSNNTGRCSKKWCSNPNHWDEPCCQ